MTIKIKWTKKANKRPARPPTSVFTKNKSRKTTLCLECNKHIKKTTWRFHILSQKHLQNTLKIHKTFLEKLSELHGKLSMERVNIRKLCVEIHDLIEGEYYENGVETITPIQ
jgi:hypothetical protein